ncbi:hypothetical protein CU100_18190 [Phyllobacterium endophyticum]|uniref:Uncharacterized protein n=1 Tax=Phyllobacterium endophyticum TaxID=1149773 RepID=A0A2P7ASI7_9HYPH|nr:hypothetical protein CU100_18190 [Phyllobacterium endophyticum]
MPARPIRRLKPGLFAGPEQDAIVTDLLVFTPLEKKGLVKAAFVSSVDGLIVDSRMFLGSSSARSIS